MSFVSEPYPVQLEVDYPDRLSRLLIFVKWLLVIPQWIALMFVGVAALLAAVVSWFVVIITGRYPRGMYNFVAGMLRWGARVYGYMYLMTDRYPPFSLVEDAAYPVRLRFSYPEHVARWRPLLHWLLSIPVYVVVYVLGIVASVVAFLAWFAILILGRMPRPLFDVLCVHLAWQMRFTAYVYFMVEPYPPFAWA